MLGFKLGKGETTLEMPSDLQKEKGEMVRKPRFPLTALPTEGGQERRKGPVYSRQKQKAGRLTLLISARLRTLSTTSSGCFFQGDDIALEGQSS